MKSVHVTVELKMFLDEEEITQKMEADNLTESQAIEAISMEQVPDGDNFKIRDVIIHLPTFR